MNENVTCTHNLTGDTAQADLFRGWRTHKNETVSHLTPTIHRYTLYEQPQQAAA